MNFHIKSRIKHKLLFIDKYNFLDQLNLTFYLKNRTSIKLMLPVINIEKNLLLINLIFLEQIIGLNLSLKQFNTYKSNILFFVTLNRFKLYILIDFYLSFCINNEYAEIFIIEKKLEL